MTTLNENLDYIYKTLTNNYHGQKFDKNKDMYLKGNTLFINQNGSIDIYKYPMNDYFEIEDQVLNLTTLPFKQFIDFHMARNDTTIAEEDSLN